MVSGEWLDALRGPLFVARGAYKGQNSHNRGREASDGVAQSAGALKGRHRADHWDLRLFSGEW